MKKVMKTTDKEPVKSRSKPPEYKSSGKKPKMKTPDKSPTASRAKAFC